jgi:ATP-binding cassette subfamily F protein 3
VREERAAEEAAAKQTAAQSKPKPAAKRAAGATSTRGGSVKQQAKLEEQIEQAEAALREIEGELADASAWSTPARSAESTARHEAAKRAVEELYARYEQVAG